MTRGLRWLLCGVLLVAIGCGEDFDPYNRLTKLRVLAIQSEPVAPGSGETTTLTPLVYTPPSEAGSTDPELTYAWSWCPLPASPADGAKCLVDEAALGEMAAEFGLELPPYDLGGGPTATFTNPFTAEVIATICQGGSTVLPVLRCDQGFPVQITLTLRRGEQQVITTRRLRLRGEPAVGDTNPRIDGVAVFFKPEERTDLPEERNAETPSVTRGKETKVAIGIPQGLDEPYEDTDERGEPVQKRELMAFTWFTESGEMKSVRTSHIGEGALVDDDVALQNEWRPGGMRKYPRDSARLIVVVRDDRDGVGWRSGVALLGEPEP